MFYKLKIMKMLFYLLCLYAYPIFAHDIQVVTEEFPPYNYTENGLLVGASTEVVRAVLDKLDLKADIAVYPWLRAYNMALIQENTLIYSLVRAQDREHLFQWIGSIAPVQACLFSLRSNGNVNINTPTDIKKYTIITHRTGRISQSLLSSGLTDKSQIRLTVSMDDNFSMLLTKRIDLIASPKLFLEQLIMKRGYDPQKIVKKQYCLEVDNMYMAFSLKTPKTIVENFREALDDFKKSEKYQSIINKYLN